MWTSRFHFCFQSFSSGSCRWINNIALQSQQDEESWSGSCGKSMYRSIQFVWIDSGHEHQMGQEDVCAWFMCEWMPVLHEGNSITFSVGQWRWRSCNTVKICTNMLGIPVLSVLSVEPIIEIWILLCSLSHWRLILPFVRWYWICHQRDTLTLCDAFNHKVLTKCFQKSDHFPAAMKNQRGDRIIWAGETVEISMAFFSPHSPPGYIEELCEGLNHPSPQPVAHDYDSAT